MLDEITRAVLSSDEIAKYLEDAHGDSGREARERIEAYLEELRTTQRYSMYRALKQPFNLLLRNVERIGENIEAAKAATRAGRVVYVPTIAATVDYLVEPLVLDDNGVRPPVIAAGINVLGGPLGLLWRHVAGAMPIRRNSRDAGVPDDAQSVRRRAAAQTGPVVLSRRRSQLQRRDQAAEDRAAERGASSANIRTSGSFRPPCPTTWSSRTTCSRVSG